MRCIEMVFAVNDADKARWLTLTWDVLKLQQQL